MFRIAECIDLYFPHFFLLQKSSRRCYKKNQKIGGWLNYFQTEEIVEMHLYMLGCGGEIRMPYDTFYDQGIHIIDIGMKN